MVAIFTAPAKHEPVVSRDEVKAARKASSGRRPLAIVILGILLKDVIEKDVKDAFGDLPRQAVLLFALTEVRLLAQHFGISSVHRRGCTARRGVTRSGVEDGIELMLAHDVREGASLLAGGLWWALAGALLSAAVGFLVSRR